MNVQNLFITPRFNDCDLMGHVNNAIYLSYIEEARIFFFKQILPEDWNWKENGIIIKKHEIIYEAPLFLDQKIEIKSSVGIIRNTSFELYHTIYVNQKVKTKVTTTLVYYDYTTNQSKKLDNLILEVLKS